jgi:hypothetical protein
MIGDRRYSVAIFDRQVRSGAEAEAFSIRRMSEAVPSVVYEDRGARINESTLVATGRFVGAREVRAVLGQDDAGFGGSESPPWRVGRFDFRVEQKLVGSGALLATLARDGSFHMKIAVDRHTHEDEVNGMTIHLHSLDDIRRAARTPRVLRVLDTGELSPVPPR